MSICQRLILWLALGGGGDTSLRLHLHEVEVAAAAKHWRALSREAEKTRKASKVNKRHSVHAAACCTDAKADWKIEINFSDFRTKTKKKMTHGESEAT